MSYLNWLDTVSIFLNRNSPELPSYCKKCTTETIPTFQEGTNITYKVQGFKKMNELSQLLGHRFIFSQPPFLHIQSPERTYCIKYAANPQNLLMGTFGNLGFYISLSCIGQILKQMV